LLGRRQDVARRLRRDGEEQAELAAERLQSSRIERPFRKLGIRTEAPQEGIALLTGAEPGKALRKLDVDEIDTAKGVG